MTKRDELAVWLAELPEAVVEAWHAEAARLRVTPLLPESAPDSGDIQEAAALHHAWQDSASPLEPYDWGGVDPLTLGEPVTYVRGVGALVKGG